MDLVGGISTHKAWRTYTLSSLKALAHVTLPTHAGVHVTYLRINRTGRPGSNRLDRQAGLAGKAGNRQGWRGSLVGQ